MDPHTNPEAYDYFTLNGTESPGLCEVVGAGSPRNWDERKGYGLSGSILVFTGNALAKFSIKIRIGYDGARGRTIAEQWAEWETFRELVQKPPKGTRPKALEIYHPFLEDLVIKSVVVEDRIQFTQVDNGVFETEIKFHEYRAPSPSTSTPDGAGKEEPKDDVDQMITDLGNQLDELAK
jgi:hypothetical protein